MVTQIRKGTKPHLYIEEHMAVKDLSFETLGDRLGVSRTTVWRWAKEQWRLDPGKIAALAEAMDLETWQELGRRPQKNPSIDNILANVDQEDYDAVYDLAKRLAKRAS
jgi:transcriptional regulator with XRE-family HTH domain